MSDGAELRPAQPAALPLFDSPGPLRSRLSHDAGLLPQAPACLRR
jgi:hypothetical protein